jgi:hypothetical protein
MTCTQLSKLHSKYYLRDNAQSHRRNTPNAHGRCQSVRNPHTSAQAINEGHNEVSREIHHSSHRSGYECNPSVDMSGLSSGQRRQLFASFQGIGVIAGQWNELIVDPINCKRFVLVQMEAAVRVGHILPRIIQFDVIVAVEDIENDLRHCRNWGCLPVSEIIVKPGVRSIPHLVRQACKASQFRSSYRHRYISLKQSYESG